MCNLANPKYLIQFPAQFIETSKPSNILLQLPSSTQTLRVRISDFGLCKQLEQGHASFTKHSGVTGTDGWIAPEMIRIETLETKPTKAVDVFSLGCVFYYVYSGGHHPYGTSVHRQSNILSSSRRIEHCANDAAFTNLLDCMLHKEAAKRPPIDTIESHCFLWPDEKVLDFIILVSNKGEDAVIGAQLAQDTDHVANDWTSLIEHQVMVDLRKRRDYNANSVTHLLRAIRNKVNYCYI